MPDRPDNPFKFWDELKQRKVVRVVTVYLASAFAILEGADIVATQLKLPSWPVNIIIIILCCGLVIAIILSWIYDITPGGIVKTSDLDQVKPGGTRDGDIAIIQGELALPGVNDDLILQGNEIYKEKIIKYKRKEKIYSLSSFTVIAAAIMLFFFSSGSTLPFSKRDWILITDFENLTGNPVFNKSLYTAFSLSINQSRYINVFPKNRMLETMAMMEIEDMTYIDERTGREIALREGIGTYIVPSISEVGNRFVLTSKLMETKSGNLLHSVIVESDNQNDILAKLDQMTRKIRRTLGESRYNIVTQDKPLAEVTTSSLEALKQYSLGIECNWFGDFTGAKVYYENALKIDSGFTSAKATLGNLLIEKRFDLERGKELLNQAVKDADNLTDGEKYGILASHAVNVENDFTKGIEYFKKLSQLYPDNPAYHHNLGWYYQVTGLYKEALDEYKKVVSINPIYVLSYAGINWIYLEKLGQADSALLWAKKMISDNPQNAWGYYDLGSAYIGLDSINEAERAFQKGREINPYLLNNQYRLALTYQLQGKYIEAIRVLERMIEIKQYDAWAYYYLGINYKHEKEMAKAMENFTRFRNIAVGQWLESYPDRAETYIALAKVTAYMGNMEYSNQMIGKAIELDSSLYRDYASWYCIQGKIPKAIDQVEKALENGYRDFAWLKLDPDIKPLKDESRFLELLDNYFK